MFYVRVCKCELDDSTPGSLTLNHVPLNPDTLLEINGVRTSIYSDGMSTLLKRDRVDRKSEEVTFVSTDSIRMSGSVKFEVFDKDVLLLSGALELCNTNGVVGESSYNGQRWSMNCESYIIPGTSFFKGKQLLLPDSSLPTIEVYIAGSFLSTPIILTKTLQLSQKKHTKKGVLDAIPEHEASENGKDISSALALQVISACSVMFLVCFLYCPLLPCQFIGRVNSMPVFAMSDFAFTASMHLAIESFET